MNKHSGCPLIYRGKSKCEFVKEVKYLGFMVASSKKTNIDVPRQACRFYLQANFASNQTTLQRCLGAF